MSEEFKVLPEGGISPEHNSGTITLRLPKFNWQLTALLLIAIVAGLQAFMLARLKGAVAVRGASAAPAVTAPSASHQGLQGMVGGC